MSNRGNVNTSNIEATAREALMAMVESSRRAGGGDAMLFAPSASERTSPSAEGGLLTFPEKLMSLLNGGRVSDCMWWLPDGDAFCLQPQRFSEKVLEPHFRCKFESFTRKLNRWGFRRVAGQQVPPDTIAYFQRSFHRDKPQDLCNMTGGKTKPTPKYSSQSKVAIQQSQIASKVNDQSEGQGIVRRPSLGSSGRGLGNSPHTDISALLPSFQGNAVANLMAQAGTHSGGGLASSLQDADLERAIRIQLLRERAASDVQQQQPSFQAQASSADLATRMILAASNSGNNGVDALQLANLLGSGPSSQSLLSPQTNQVDRSTAQLASLLSSQQQ